MTDQTQVENEVEVIQTEDLSLDLFGSRNQIKELAYRLRMTSPGGRKLNDIEAIALAQMAIVYKLDPFTGDIWYIPGSGLMVGITGRRKCSDREANKLNMVYWGNWQQVDPAKYGQPDDAIVYEYLLFDNLTTRAWTQSLTDLTTAGFQFEVAVELIGRAPRIVGVGIARPSDKSKMEIHARARLRCERDALKQRFNVNFPEINMDETVIDADFEIAPPEPSGLSRTEILTDLGFDVEVDETEAEAEEVSQPSLAQALVDAKIAENIPNATAILKLLMPPDETTVEEVVQMGKGYRGWRDLGAKPDQAADKIRKNQYPK